MTDIVRVLLTLTLLGGVWHETGWVTALTLFLISLRFEILDMLEGRTFK